METLKLIDRMRDIQRLAGTPIIKQYSLMEHCYYVGMLFKHFASKCDVPYGMNEFDLILKHDLVEVVTGDLIYPVKNHSEETKSAWEIIEDSLAKHHGLDRYSDSSIKENLTKSQYDLFKLCDILDLYVFVRREQQLGNDTQEIKRVIENCVSIVSGVCGRNGNKFNKVLEYFKSI